jgi:hypothetical protein
MYARPLFVVVGIFRVFLTHFRLLLTANRELRLGRPERCGYTLAA